MNIKRTSRETKEGTLLNLSPFLKIHKKKETKYKKNDVSSSKLVSMV
jgi:hypothetical protein